MDFKSSFKAHKITLHLTVSNGDCEVSGRYIAISKHGNILGSKVFKQGDYFDDDFKGQAVDWVYAGED